MSRTLSLLLVGLSLCACKSHDPSTTTSSSTQPSYDELDAQTGSTSATTSRSNTQGLSTKDDIEPGLEAGYGSSTPEKAGTKPAADTRPQAWSDDEFVRKAVQAGVFEIESSRLALEKSSSGTVRAFATMTIDDHAKANQDLAEIARRNRGDVPDTLDLDHQKELENLRKLEGPEFDREYLECQVKSHDQAIALFERAAREAHDKELKDFATKTLPVLRKHRSHLEDMQGSPSK